MIATSDYRDLLEESLKDPVFKKEWDKIQPEIKSIRKSIDESNSKFYKDTTTGLMEAVIIEKSESAKVKQHKNFEDMFEDPSYFTDEERKEIEANVRKFAENKGLTKRK